ncbi:MAG: glycosyltransferase [Nitrospirae bacterium]|nr:glycosyltransferase [Nitrospirota bacterium]
MLTPDSFMIDRRIILEARTLIDAGHSVTLLAGFECKEEEHYVHQGIEIHRYMYDWDDEILKKIRVKLPNNDRVRMFVNRAYMFLANNFFEISPFDRFILARALEFDFDICQVHDLPCLKAGYFASKARGVPLIYDAHELYYAQEVHPAHVRAMYYRLEKKYIKYPDAVITVNPFIARLMAERYGIKQPHVLMNCTSLPEGFQTDKAPAKLREKGNIPAHYRVVLYQGWLSAERNIDTLVKGSRWFPENTCLAIIGYGAHEEVLRGIVKQEGLEGKVYFLGAVPSDEMLEYTAGADLGVIPYRPIDDNHLYCSPNKLFEYVLAGIPVVTDDLPFFREMRSKYGFIRITDMGSPEAFGKTVSDVLASPGTLSELKIKTNEAAKELNWEVEGRKLVKIYESVMRK